MNPFIKINFKSTKVKVLTIIFISLTVFTYGFFVIDSINNKSINTNVIDNPIDNSKDKSLRIEPNTVSMNMEYPNYESDKLGVMANLEGYTILSKDEIIDKYHLDDDYYDDKSINKLLKAGNSYHDLVAYNSTNNVSIDLSISISTSTYKSILNKYSKAKLDSLTKSYEYKDYKDIFLSTKTIDFLDKDTAVLASKYSDLNNNTIYQYDVFILRNKYLGTLNITSINEDHFNEVIEMFEE